MMIALAVMMEQDARLGKITHMRLTLAIALGLMLWVAVHPNLFKLYVMHVAWFAMLYVSSLTDISWRQTNIWHS